MMPFILIPVKVNQQYAINKKNMQTTIEKEIAKARRIVDAMGDGISIQSLDYTILYQNKIHQAIFNNHIGEHCYNAYWGRWAVCGRCPVSQVIEKGGIHTSQWNRRTAEGLRYFEIKASPCRDSKGRIIAGIEVVRDITAIKKAEKELKKLATTDKLTGAYNRTKFKEIIEREIERFRRHSKPLPASEQPKKDIFSFEKRRIPLHLININAIESLIRNQKGWCISIYMPTHRTAAETQQDQIRFKNLFREAEKRLIKNGLRSRQVEEFLDPLRRLLEDAHFWQHQGEGFAAFLSGEVFRYFRVPQYFQELLIVARRFHLKPLLSLLSSDGIFYLLAVSQNKVRLFLGTQFSIHEVTPGDIPENLSEALKYDDPEKQLQFHTQTAGGGKRAAMFHGQGVGIDESKDNILRYFRKIDTCLHDLFKDKHAPLILAGVEYLLPIYREANTYQNLLDEGITGNPDELSARELHKKVWAVVSHVIRRKQDEAITRYRQLAHTERASCDIKTIVPAAYQGRVDILFVAVGMQQWGAFDTEKQSVHLHKKEKSDDGDLLDFAAIQTLLHGGTVYAVQPVKVPDNATVSAIFRY
ncbi:MAG: PAS domain-containing protein [Nitrospirota bacterium]